MRRVLVLLLAAVVVVTAALIIRGERERDIEGELTGYLQRGEGMSPLAVIEGNGKTYYLSTVGLTVAVDPEFPNGESHLLELIQHGAITGIKVKCSGAHQVTMIINGEKVTVWECHQIGKLTTP